MEKQLAFISYSRRDKDVADWLHKKLEKYPYPSSMVKEGHRPPDKKFMRPVFIDTKDLRVDTRPFGEDIKKVLAQSQYLILICSRNSASSEYVDKEVRYFLQCHGDYKRIVPFFLDDVNDDTIPPSIKGTPIMERHFPIFNTALPGKSEANSYCFYQIAAFMLDIDFSYLYNRYEAHKRRKRNRAIARLSALLAFFVLAIVALLYSIQKKDELLQFEKDVYPHSIVFGYQSNFLTPVIDYLKDQGEEFHILVMMPTENLQKGHQERLRDLKYEIVKDLHVDSLTFVQLPTAMKRGSVVTGISSADSAYRHVYLDFATTTSSFWDVARYKKTHAAYAQQEVDELIREYTLTFVRQTKEELGRDSVYVEFFLDEGDLVDRLRQFQSSL